MPKRKRYFKYEKKESKSANVKCIMSYFNVNQTVAETYASILNESEVNQINSIIKESEK